MSENVCHRYFDTTIEVVLQVESSQVGLGAVVLQDGKPAKVRCKTQTAKGYCLQYNYMILKSSTFQVMRLQMHHQSQPLRWDGAKRS